MTPFFEKKKISHDDPCNEWNPTCCLDLKGKTTPYAAEENFLENICSSQEDISQVI
jgi:hypothetical protein